MQAFIRKNHWSDSRSLVSDTSWSLGPHWDFSWTFHCCLVSWRSCSPRSVGLTSPSTVPPHLWGRYVPGDHWWGGCWRGPTHNPDYAWIVAGLVSTAAIPCLHQRCPGQFTTCSSEQRGGNGGHSYSNPHTIDQQESQGNNSSWAEIWRQELIQKLQTSATYPSWLVQPPFLYIPRAIYTGVALPILIWAPTCTTSLPTDQSQSRFLPLKARVKLM